MHSKRNHQQKIKRQPKEQENIFADTSCKEVNSQNYKKLKKFNMKKTTQLKNGQKTRINTSQTGHTDGQ